MTIEEFTKTARRFRPAPKGEGILSSASAFCGLALAAAQVYMTTPTVEASQDTAEAAAGATALASDLYRQDDRLHELHQHLLDLIDDYDEERIQTTWSRISVLAEEVRSAG